MIAIAVGTLRSTQSIKSQTPILERTLIDTSLYALLALGSFTRILKTLLTLVEYPRLFSLSISDDSNSGNHNL